MKLEPLWVHDPLPEVTQDQENFEYYDANRDELIDVPIEYTVIDEGEGGVIIDCEYEIGSEVDTQCLEDQLRDFKFNMEYRTIYNLTFSQKI